VGRLSGKGRIILMGALHWVTRRTVPVAAAVQPRRRRMRCATRSCPGARCSCRQAITGADGLR